MNIQFLEFGWLEKLLAAGLILFAVGYVVWLLMTEKRGMKQKKETVRARVAAKAAAKSCGQQTFVLNGQNEIGLVENEKLYRITFEEIADVQGTEGQKNQCVCLVPEQIYAKLQEGDEALLVRRGNRLLQFGELSGKQLQGCHFVAVNQEYDV